MSSKICLNFVSSYLLPNSVSPSNTTAEVLFLFRIREVEPDSEGNSFALYGCFAHQHPLTRIRKSEIVFENYKDALDFFEKTHKGMYRRRNCTSRAEG